MTQINYPFPKAILFDWDNTLIDSMPVIYQAMSKTYDHFGLKIKPYDEYKHQLGLSLRNTFPDLFGNRWEEAKEMYLNAFQELHLEMLSPYEQALELLEYASEKVGCLGVVSNKTGYILRKEVSHLGWDKYFCGVVGAMDTANDKPALDPVLLALEKSGITYKDGKMSDPVWFVGDGDADILCARNADCYPVRIADMNKDGPDVLTLKNCTELLSSLYSYEGTM